MDENTLKHWYRAALILSRLIRDPLKQSSANDREWAREFIECGPIPPAVVCFSDNLKDCLLAVAGA